MTKSNDGEDGVRVIEIEPGTLLIGDALIRCFVMNGVPNLNEESWPFKLIHDVPCTSIVRGMFRPSPDSEGLHAAAKKTTNQEGDPDDLSVSSQAGNEKQNIYSNPDFLRTFHQSDTVDVSIYVVLQSSSLDDLETATDKLQDKSDEANIDLTQVKEDYDIVFRVLNPEKTPMDDAVNVGMMGLAAMLTPNNPDNPNEEMWENIDSDK